MSFGYSYTFPALRGTQAGQDYYVAMCPLRLLPKLFIFDDISLPAKLRAQRTLNTARIPEIANYILNNPKSYAFSAITASIDGTVHFKALPLNDDINEALGLLTIPMSARFIINDGQHRRAAIEAALETQPELGSETIAVVFFLDTALERSQQLFADLNQHAVKPTKSLNILYDSRNPLADLARYLAESAAPFKGLIEMEKTTISNRSIPLFTLSAVYQATQSLLDKPKREKITSREKALALSFWDEFVQIFPEWQMVTKKQVRSAELRRDYVHAHGVVLHALGLAGHDLVQKYPEAWPQQLGKLETLDWRRTNTAIWEGRAMSSGRMSKATRSVQLTANLLKETLGLPLTVEEKKLEEQQEALKKPSLESMV